MDKIENYLSLVIQKLDKIIYLQEKQISNSSYKGLGNPMWTGLPVDCVSKDEVPLPTPWNTDYKPSCGGDCICGKDNIDNL